MANPRRKRPVSVVYCKKLIQVIHVGARRDLAMDEDTYRDMLEGVTGKRSTKDMEPWELERVLDRLYSLGFVKKGGKNGPPAHKMADDPQSKMIRALWLKLADMGQVRNPSEDALNAFVRRQTGRDRLEWISSTQASNVIEALKSWVVREGGTVE